ncbi:neurochondrin-like [Zophobas morio]|uniref:neurochondrin-like n=1 Tax=Zophobas morio TaxID=2755281 RepID=UPI003083874D
MQPDLLPLLQKSLSELFRSKLTAEFRRKCLTLTADLSFLWDLEWLEDGEGHVLASCIAHTCVEIRMIIDDSSVAELEKQEKLLFSCFVILEKALQFFSEGSSASVCSSFAPFVICRTNTSITDAIKSILRMFRDVRILSCVEHAQEDEGLPTVLHACIRMVSVWLVCDPEDLDGDVLETLPSLITLCSSRQSFAKLLLPALCQLTREANYAACFTAHGGHSVIDHYLADHMGDCRETLSVCSGLNVFLNILTAQETAVSTKPEVFTSLVNTLCNARPPADDTCKATAAVVGLLIVRQTSEVDLCSTETNCYADFLRVYASFLASLLLCKSRTDGQEDGEELLCLARLAVQGLRECMEKGEAHRHVLIESKLVHELLRALPPRLDDLQLDSNLHREIVKLLASLRQWPEGNTVLQGYNL